MKLSLLVLAWNHASYIEQALRSAKEQNVENYEVIFLDNCSTDDTYAIGCKYLQDWGIPHQCYQNETPKGITANANFLFSKASGEYIIYLSADDWHAPNTFQKKIDFLDSHPGVGMVYTGGTSYFEDTNTYVPIDNKNFRRGRFFKELLTESNCLFFVGCCYRTSIFRQLGGWDENLLIEDLDLFIRLAQVSDIDFIDEPMVFYRRFSGGASANVSFMVEGWEQYYQKYKEMDWLDMKAWMAERYRSYAAVALDQSKTQLAGKLIGKSLRLKPLQKKMLGTIKYFLQKALNKKNSASA